MEDLALELGCKVDSLPTSYLRLMLGAKHNSIAIWDGGVTRFKKETCNVELKEVG